MIQLLTTLPCNLIYVEQSLDKTEMVQFSPVKPEPLDKARTEDEQENC